MKYDAHLSTTSCRLRPKRLSQDIRWHLALAAAGCLTANLAQAGANFPPVFDLAQINGQNGFQIEGWTSWPKSGFSVSGIGDLNGDGFEDVVIGAPSANYGPSNAGISYVVFGSSNDLSAINSLSSLNGSNGFRLEGVNIDGYSGRSVSAAGDINGDGVPDLIIGAPNEHTGGSDSGSSYVVFGRTEGFDAKLSLGTLDGNNGFRLDGMSVGERFGYSVSSAGDINGDTVDDLVIGAPDADHGGPNSGSSYVVFGKTTSFDASMNLSSLNASSGFRLDGGAFDHSGHAVSAAGDINGDGMSDLVIGAPISYFDGQRSGSSYVLFGNNNEFNSTINLTSLNGSNGFRLTGESVNDRFGYSVSGAGDVNGDGISDFIIGAWNNRPSGIGSGSSYVVYGNTNGFTPNIDVSTLNGSNGHRIDGVGNGDHFGQSVSSAGDINGDGLADLIIGAPESDSGGPNSGSSYVVFGKTSAIDATLGVSTLNGSNGFRLDGVNILDFSGSSVSGAGDINGDGVDDLIIGANAADNGGYGSGSSYIVFGKTDGFALNLSLSTLNGSNGVRWDGFPTNSRFSGRSVNGAGDINGDGIGDLIIGAPEATFGEPRSGFAYVVFGRANKFSPRLNLAALDGSDGFQLKGVSTYDHFGNSVAAAGDINGDGLHDIIVGAFYADHGGHNSGSSYVVFGSSSGFNARLHSSALDGDNGFRLDGLSFRDYSGWSVSPAGDINGDGITDLIIGARGASYSGKYSGSSYVVFGHTSGFDSAIGLSALDGSNGFRLDGVSAFDHAGSSVSIAGDINHDGLDDLIIGAPNTDHGGSNSGSSYVIFGQTNGFDPAISLSILDGTNGFRIDGTSAHYNSVRAVSDAGDINDDGVDDFIIGAPFAFNGTVNSGVSYVVFGRSEEFEPNLSLSSLNGSNGFRIDGISSGDHAGAAVSSAGDVNGDGVDDLIIGASYSSNNEVNSGSSYVVFGRSEGFPTTISLSGLDGSNGFRLDGSVEHGNLGFSVSAAGDINNDGAEDLLIGAPGEPGAGISGIQSGRSYVVFGRRADMIFANGFEVVD